MKSVIRTPEQALFTPAEAAALTHLPLKAVNKAIDKRKVDIDGENITFKLYDFPSAESTA